MVAKSFKDCGPVDGSAKLITKENAFALEKVLQCMYYTPDFKIMLLQGYSCYQIELDLSEAALVRDELYPFLERKEMVPSCLKAQKRIVRHYVSYPDVISLA